VNGYRFKVELTAWAAKTALCTLTVVVLTVMLFEPADTVRDYPLGWRSVAENDWVFSALFTGFTALMWLCYWKIIREFRSRRAYCER
jgi:hypothetical protein